MPNLQVKNRVYLNADKTKAVPEGSPDAVSLLVGVNGTVTEDVAKKYDLSEDGAPGQKSSGQLAGAFLPHGVNENSPDGVNTAPGTPAATGAVAAAEAAKAADASAKASKAEKAAAKKAESEK